LGQGGGGVHIRVTVDRADGVYRAGEEVRFGLESRGDISNQGSLTYRLSWNGETKIERSEVPGLPREITYRPGEPGFLKLSIHDSAKGEPLSQAAAAVSPEKIAPSMPVPEDFDDFWRDQLAKDLPDRMRAGIVKHSRHREGTIFRTSISMPRVGDVYGWILKPLGEGPFPCVVRYHGAGVYPVPPENGLDLASRGFMVLSINSHSITNERPLAYYEELERGALADYRTRGREDRQKVYFRGMFLRAAGAVAFMRDYPDCDPEHLMIEGHSQGGGQALAGAALGGDIDGLVVSCPTHCDHTGPVIGRVAGWPKIVNVRDGVPDPREVEAARYIDGVNFASMIDCPTLFSVGFLDDTCPPTGVYAAYNSLAGPKEINNEVTAGHLHTERFKQATYRWQEGRIGVA